MPTQRDHEVTPAQELEAASVELARADSAFHACGLKEASDAYSRVLQSLFERAGREPFDRLASQLKPRMKRADSAAQDFETLQGMLEALRLDASPRECAFETDRGEKARGLLRRLPAGCSRDLAPEVNQLLAAAAQRRRDQDTFWSAVESGRKLERGCRHSAAAERFAAALAVLDADAAAKCGAAEVEHTTVKERDLPGALSAERIRAEFQRQLEEARTALEAGSAAAALGTLNPLLARIGAHGSAACYEGERRKGEELAVRAGTALASPPSALAKLPDPVEGTLGAVARERAKADAEAEARRKRELAEQSPVSIEELPGVDAPQQATDPPAPPPGREAVQADEDLPKEKGDEGADAPAGDAAMTDEEIAAELGRIEAQQEAPKPKRKPAAKRSPAKRRRS